MLLASCVTYENQNGRDANPNDQNETPHSETGVSGALALLPICMWYPASYDFEGSDSPTPPNTPHGLLDKRTW